MIADKVASDPRAVKAYEVLVKASNEALKKEFGQPSGEMMMAIACAQMHLALRYFSEMRAPAAVVLDFFAKFFNMELEDAKDEIQRRVDPLSVLRRPK